jgi:hypothetical protein
MMILVDQTVELKSDGSQRPCLVHPGVLYTAAANRTHVNVIRMSGHVLCFLFRHGPVQSQRNKSSQTLPPYCSIAVQFIGRLHGVRGHAARPAIFRRRPCHPSTIRTDVQTWCGGGCCCVSLHLIHHATVAWQLHRPPAVRVPTEAQND